MRRKNLCMKKGISAFVASAMMLTSVPAPALAANVQEVDVVGESSPQQSEEPEIEEAETSEDVTAEEVTVEAASEEDVEIEEISQQSQDEEQTGEESDVLLADFNFDAEAEGGGFTGGSAKASGSYTLEDHDGGKAIHLDGSSQFLTVTDAEGNSLLTGKDAVTFSYDIKNDRTNTNWAFYVAKDANAPKYGTENYLAAMHSEGKLSVERYKNGRAAHSDNSVSVKADVANDGWHHVDVVVVGDTTRIFVDGALSATASTKNKDAKISDIFSSNSVFYIGKANWGSGEFCQASIDNFKVYDGVKSDLASAIVVQVKEGLTLGDTTAVEDNLTLPTEKNGVSISWESSNQEVISNAGTVVRPQEDTEVTLTATLTCKNETDTKTFTVHVLKDDSTTLENYLVASYNFDDESLTNQKDTDKPAVAKTKNLASDYAGDITYEAGRSGKAVRLGQYGLDLNQKNLGKEFTVSAWMKPDGTFSENQILMFLGHYEANVAEQWMGISGKTNGTNTCKIWGKGGNLSTWTTFFSPEISSDGWHRITLTGKENTLSAYLDGELIGTTDQSNNPLDGENMGLYIGVNFWDKMFSGLVDDVRVYNKAITGSVLADSYLQERVEEAAGRLDIGDVSAVRENLTLPSTIDPEVTVEWSSDKPDVIANDGTVTRPKDADKKVTLTATLTKGTGQTTKDFEVTVVQYSADVDVVSAKEALNMLSFTDHDLQLPESGKFGTEITWESSDTEWMTDDGKIEKRPATGEGSHEVTMTATISKDGKSAEKKFKIEIMEEAYGYIMGYVTGDNDRTGSLHLAYSQDGKNFTALNGNSGILYAKNDTNDGTKNLSTGVRYTGTYLFRKADGTFGLVAPQGKNKKSVYLYESEDLLTFTGEKLLSTNGSANISAAECSYDTLIGSYRVNWTDGTNEYSNISSDLTKLDAAQEYDYGPSSYEVETIPEGAKNYNVIPVTKAEYEKLLARFATVSNTGIEMAEAITVGTAAEVKDKLPKTLTASYSDGSQSELNVTWDTNKDLSEAGTYVLSGTITPYSNPLIEQRADPQIKYDESEKCYYFTASYPAFNSVNNGYDRIVLRKADSIQELSDDNGGVEKEITIWSAPSSGQMAKHVWAPELQQINGKWYVFFAAGNSDNIWAIRPYVLVCQGDDPYNADNWKKADGTYEIHAATSEDSAYFKNMSLDMTYFEHNGNHYVIWADIIGQSALYMQQIDPDQPWTGTGKVIQLTTPEFGWERDTERVNEGPTILKHGDKIFCAFSASGTGPEYCIGMLYADADADLMDPASWTKMNYPLLTSADVPGEYGPGHNSFTVDAGGNPVFVYHARSEECYNNQCQWANSSSLYDPCRHARVKNVHWTEDGLPILKMSAEEECPTEMRSVSIKVTVEQDSDKKLSEAVISDIEEMEATGEQLQPEITVTYKGEELKEGTDYTVAYGENKEVGKGSVTITPVENSGFIGSKTVEFDIVKPAVQVVHYDMSRSGDKLQDTANAYDGTLTDVDESNFHTYNGVTTLALNKDGYVSLPKGIVDDNTLTINVTAATTQANNQWLWAIGKDSWNYAFLTPSNGSKNTKFAIAQQEKYNSSGAWAAEKQINTSAKALDGKYQTYTLTINGDKTVMYVNGVKVGEGENPFDLTSFISGQDVIGYIGKSLYSGDPLFVGQVADFSVYDDALTANQVKKIADSTDYEGYITADIYGTMLKKNPSADAVTTNLSFPSKVDGVDVTWNVQEGQDVISDAGKVVRPIDGKDAQVTVTASYEWNGKNVSEEFKVTVKAQNLQELVNKISLPYSTEAGKEVYGNITLPESVENLDITWTTDHPEIVDVEKHENTGAYADDPTPAGCVTRPAKDTVVMMTATLQSGSEKVTKDFTFTVKAAPKALEESDFTDYFFAYFVGQNAANQEQIYFSASQDGLNWKDLNDNKPYLTSTLGEKGVRDPFILRSHEGDKFYLIATDLSIYYNGDWGRAQTAGSNSLMVWESTDLVNWSEQRMVEVSADIGAGCTWAPEATYDEETGEYVVYWASKTPDDNYSKQRIWYAKTRDFYSFTEAQVMIDNADTTIDTTILKENGWYYRYSKNEKNKNIIAEKTQTLLHSDAVAISTPVLGSQGGVEGPTIFKFNEDDVEKNGAKYCLLLDNYGGGGYYPMVSNDLDGDFTRLTSGYKLPGGGKTPRHGTPMRITAAEYQKVMAAMAGTATASSIKLDGRELTDFDKDVKEYTVTIQGFDYPEVTAEAADGIKVEVTQPTPENPVATVKTTNDNLADSIYTITFVSEDITLTPEPESQGGNIVVNVPETAPGTAENPANVSVTVGKNTLAELITNSSSKTVSLVINVPDSMTASEGVNLESLILTKAVWKAAMDGERNLDITVNGVNGHSYNIFVNSEDIAAGRLANMNLLLDITGTDKDADVKDKLYADERGMTVNFHHRTDLPSTVTVTVDGTDYGFVKGNKVSVRSYRTSDGTLGTVRETCKVGQGGKTSFTVSRGAKYVLTNTIPITLGNVKVSKTSSTTSKVVLTWNKVKGADGYRVYRYNSKKKAYERIAEVKTNSFTDTSRTAGTGYSYKIRAFAKESKYYFGAYTSTIKVLTKIAAPSNVKAKRISAVSTRSKAELSFNTVKNATTYRIYKYNSTKKKYEVAFRVVNNKLYSYNAKTRQYKKVNDVTVKKGVMTCTLVNLNLRAEKSQKYMVRSTISKTGYETQYSADSKTVTIK
ncbi:MAG: family 43 glycosylhydrolase [Clostridiales bacterium]|nr:family 43 glycosylhydrolase [Clostridiales bacterium]